MTEVRVTHIGGPTTLIEADGWRLLTDPTFDPPGGRYAFGWGTSSRKLAGPALGVADLPPIDAVLLTHDHHGDNLDTAGRALLPGVGTVLTTLSGQVGSGATRAVWRPGRARGWRRPDARRSTSRRLRPAMVRRCPGRSPGTSSASRSAGRASGTVSCGSPATPSCTRAYGRWLAVWTWAPPCCIWAASVFR